MTVLEYAIARQVNILREAKKARSLTDEEQEFLKRTRALMKRLADQEKA